MEMLVSVTIVSLLAATILFGWRVAASAWGRVNELTEEQRRAVAVHQVLATQIAEMVPAAVRTQSGGLSVFFQGEPQTARFVSRYSLAHRSRSGLYLVEYHIAAGGAGGRRLLLKETPVRGPQDYAPLLEGVEETAAGPLLRFAAFAQGAHTRVLLEGLDEAYFEYFRDGEWVEQWSSRVAELPRAMAIRIHAPAVGSRLTATTIVAGIEHYSRPRR